MRNASTMPLGTNLQRDNKAPDFAGLEKHGEEPLACTPPRLRCIQCEIVEKILSGVKAGRL